MCMNENEVKMVEQKLEKLESVRTHIIQQQSFVGKDSQEYNSYKRALMKLDSSIRDLNMVLVENALAMPERELAEIVEANGTRYVREDIVAEEKTKAEIKAGNDCGNAALILAGLSGVVGYFLGKRKAKKDKDNNMPAVIQ